MLVPTGRLRHFSHVNESLSSTMEPMRAPKLHNAEQHALVGISRTMKIRVLTLRVIRIHHPVQMRKLAHSGNMLLFKDSIVPILMPVRRCNGLSHGDILITLGISRIL